MNSVKQAGTDPRTGHPESERPEAEREKTETAAQLPDTPAPEEGDNALNVSMETAQLWRQIAEAERYRS